MQYIIANTDRDPILQWCGENIGFMNYQWFPFYQTSDLTGYGEVDRTSANYVPVFLLIMPDREHSAFFVLRWGKCIRHQSN